MNIKATLLALYAVLFVCSTASAAFELRLNTATQEFALFGSDSGTPGVFGEGEVAWRLLNLGGSGDGAVGYDNDIAFSTSVGTPGNSFLGYDLRIVSGTVGSGSIILFTGMSSQDPQTLTGSGVFQSYSAISDAGAITRLESTIGQSLSLVTGTGFSSVSVTAVPEPSTYAMLFAVAALGLALWRRKLSA